MMQSTKKADAAAVMDSTVHDDDGGNDEAEVPAGSAPRQGEMTANPLEEGGVFEFANNWIPCSSTPCIFLLVSGVDLSCSVCSDIHVLIVMPTKSCVCSSCVFVFETQIC